MEIRPIVSALMRNKVAMVLIGLQVALTLAIVCNSLFIIVDRFQLMRRPSGMNESDTFTFKTEGFGAGFDVRASKEADVALMRQIPGVSYATAINSLPMSGGGMTTSILLVPGQKTTIAEPALYFVDSDGIDAFGTQLIVGRNFKPAELVNWERGNRLTPPVIIVTKAFAEQLFPDENALGRQIYMDDGPPGSVIVGIVDRLQNPWPEHSDVENAILVPGFMPYGDATRYLVRTASGRRDEVMKIVQQTMEASNSFRIVNSLRSMEDVRRKAYSSDRAMMILIGAVIVCLLAVTALGVVGMASFWVEQRNKEIGTRRALGATRRAILLYFLTENFLTTTGGLIAGLALCYAINVWLLMHTKGAKLLPWYYVPIGFICLWTLGQLAVLGPASRASRIPPAVATRGA